MAKKIKGKVTSTPVTKKPAISEITKSGNTITVKWTKGEPLSGNKSGQKYICFMMTEQGEKQKVTSKLAVSATSFTYTINASEYYPNTGKPKVLGFMVYLANKTTGKLYSEYDVKTFTITPPSAPVMDAPVWGGTDNSNVTTFSWNTTSSENAPSTNIALQTVAKQNCPQDISGLSEWASASVSTQQLSSSITYTESNLAGISLTRCVRIKARGMGGDSAWVYASNTYAQPNAPSNVKTKANTDTSNNTTNIEASWDTQSDFSTPVDKATLQYLITVPAAGLAVPAGSSFTDYAGATDTNGIDGMGATITGVLDYDEALFTQIKTEHNGQYNYSAVKLALLGKLTVPTGLSVSQNQTTYKATITATNASAVPDSYLAVYYMPKTTPATTPFIVGYIPHGGTSVTVQCPNWSRASAVAFGVKAIQGSTPVATTRSGSPSYSIYSIATINMQSDMQTVGGTVPIAPTSTSATQVDDNGTVLVKWNWAWSDADVAEISWANHDDAWESTDEPDTYQISNMHAAQWRISNLTLGEKWYVRVRLGIQGDEDVTFGPYCNPMAVDLTSAPEIPVIRLSSRIIRPKGSVTVSWNYGTTDGTLQNYAEIFEVSSGTYTQIANTKTAQHITLTAGSGRLSGWTANTQHTICMRVWSDSNRHSSYSATTVVTIANPLTCTITTGAGFTGSELKALPATVTVTGAGTAGTSTLVIERAQSYSLVTPDEEEHAGYEGETIYLKRYSGQPSITISQDDLIGRLDDTAPYNIVATVQDTYGQTAEATFPFTVAWTNQAIMPTGTAVLDTDNEIAKITPTEPEGAQTGDYVNIYRLSADKPVLIYEGAEFGTTYVDPYPTIGEFGGYRLAYMTANGDFITSDLEPAILDIPLEYDMVCHIIDFGDAQVQLAYNLTESDSWEKDFQQTRYLGGAVQGDWAAGVLRSGSASSSILAVTDNDVKEALRRLAVYTGLCHVRTRNGSNFTANVNVNEEMAFDIAAKGSQFTLDFQACDNPDLDGMSLEDWETSISL